MTALLVLGGFIAVELLAIIFVLEQIRNTLRRR